MRSYGADVQFFGTDGLDTEQHARAYAASHNMAYLAPCNDIAGRRIVVIICGGNVSQQVIDQVQ